MSQFTQLNGEIKELKEKNNELNEENQNLTEKLQLQQNSTLRSLSGLNEEDQEKENRIQELEEKNKQLQEDNSTFKKEWKENMQKIQQQWGEKEKENNNLKREKLELQSEIHKVQTLQERIKELEITNDQLERDLKLAQNHLKDLSSQPTKEQKRPIPLNLESDIRKYSENLNSLYSEYKQNYPQNQRYEVNETSASSNNRRHNNSKEVICETPNTGTGSFWIYCQSDSIGYLFPKNNQFRSSENPTAMGLFDGYKGGDNRFVLERPAIVSKSGKQWTLMEKGDLRQD